MARSNVRTWLSLDRWAEIIGLNPLHLNQLASATLLPDNVCGEIWFQFSWQHADRVGRDDVAMAIQAAEQEISAEAGFNLMPDWTEEERLGFTTPVVPGSYHLTGTNPRGMYNSIELKRGHIISGGIRSKLAIQIGAAIVRSDQDGDGYNETCTITVPTALTDTNEIHAFYPGQNGDDVWEIRPIQVSISGGNAIITFKIWQAVLANAIEKPNPDVLDADTATNFETTIDVYRVYNNPNTQVQFMWEGNAFLNGNCCGSCVACQFGTQAGCFHLRDARLGLAVPSPAYWDDGSQTFVQQEWTACRAPDQVRFWYYSGYRNPRLDRSYVTMDPFWEYAVAYFAASKLDRPTCGCSNVSEFVDHWRTDLIMTKDPNVNMNVTPELLSNKLGTTLGAIYAYKRVHQNGIRIIK